MSRTEQQIHRERPVLRPLARPIRFEPLNVDLPPQPIKFQSYSITFEQLNLQEEKDPALDEALAEVRMDLYEQMRVNPKAAIKPLEALLDKFPNSRLLLNWLSAAYANAGQLEKSEQLLRQNYELHPEYLFARLNYAQVLLRHDKLDEAAAVVQNKWDLKLLYPHRDSFHYTEFLALGHVAVEYLMRTGKEDEASSILRMMKQVDPEHDTTRDATRIIKNHQSLQAQRELQSELAQTMQNQRAQGWAWRWDGLESWSTEAILKQAQEIGIQTDAARFRDEAAAAGRFKTLQDQWVGQIPEDKKAAGFWEDFPLLGIPVLWERLAPDMICPDLIERRLYQVINAEEEDRPVPDVDGLPADVAAAMEMIRYLQGIGPSERAARYDQIEGDRYYDYTGWLLELIETRGPEYPDAITEIADVMSDCREAGQFQSELAMALARAGRRDDAASRARRNIERFPQDVWARILAGDVFDELGDDAEASRLWVEALSIAEELDEWEAAYDRLEDAWIDTEREDELYKLQETYPAPESQLTDPPPLVAPQPEPRFDPPQQLTSARTVGRNDPCPCGSGKKYKKCCMP